MRRPVAIFGALAVTAAIAVVIAGVSDGAYSVRLELDNAGGLREGSTVRVGGVEVGEVVSLQLDQEDVAVAELELERSATPVGEGAAADVRAANLLGQKFVDLDQGDISKPLASGAAIPRDRTSVSVDLDQVLNVLDADTRARLAILINEAGLALTGRQADFNALLERLPPSLEAATRMLDELAADNRALGRLVDRGDTLLARVSRERRELGELVEAAGGAMRTVSTKRESLHEALERAPQSLASLRAFLTELRSATEPLGPAARAVTASAPPLTRTLTALGPFERAARPVFEEAIEIAPSLSRLGEEGTPILRRAKPTARALARFSQTMRPASEWVDRSANDTFGMAEAWARAIQERDGLGHYFRAIFVVSDDFMANLIPELDGDGATGHGRSRARNESAPGREPEPAAGPETGPGGPLESLPGAALDAPLDQLPEAARRPAKELEWLHDFLLAP